MEAKTSAATLPQHPAWKMPNVFPSVSMKYPCQHTPGTANFGKAICPPALRIFAAVASKFATSIEQTEGVGSMLRWRRLCRTLQQTASRPFRLDPPVFNRQSFRLTESPAKDLAVKSHGAVGIVGLNFKIMGAFIGYPL